MRWIAQIASVLALVIVSPLVTPGVASALTTGEWFSVSYTLHHGFNDWHTYVGSARVVYDITNVNGVPAFRAYYVDLKISGGYPGADANRFYVKYTCGGVSTESRRLLDEDDTSRVTYSPAKTCALGRDMRISFYVTWDVVGSNDLDSATIELVRF